MNTIEVNNLYLSDEVYLATELSTKFISIELTTSDLSDSVIRLDLTTIDLSSSTISLSNSIDDISSELSATKVELLSAINDIELLSSNITSLSSKDLVHDLQINALSSDVSSLESKDLVHDSKINALSSGLSSSTISLSNSISAISILLSDLCISAQSTIVNVKTLSSDVSSLESKDLVHDSKINALSASTKNISTILKQYSLNKKIDDIEKLYDIVGEILVAFGGKYELVDVPKQIDRLVSELPVDVLNELTTELNTKLESHELLSLTSDDAQAIRLKTLASYYGVNISTVLGNGKTEPRTEDDEVLLINAINNAK